MLGDKQEKVIGEGYGSNPYDNKQFQLDPRQDGIKAADECIRRVINTAGKYYPLSIKVIKNGWMDLQELTLKYLQQQSNETLAQILLLLRPLIKKKAYKLSQITKVDHIDLEQELVIVIMNRLKSYNPTKGKFLTYLINTTKGDPTDTMSTLVCKKRGGDGKKNFASNISLSQPINKKEDSKEIRLEDTISAGKDFRNDVDISLVRDLLKTHTEKEVRKILKREGY